MKEERPTEPIATPDRPYFRSLKEFTKEVEMQGKTVEEVLRSYNLVIYVEKQHVAERLLPLAELGIAIITGRGFPTRYLRMLAKYGKLVVLTDSDKSGLDIREVIRYGSKRHRRIGGEDFARMFANEGAVVLGLTYEDAKKLGLLPIPETPKHRKLGYTERYELDALSSLEARGVENPYLAYVAAKIKLLGLTVKIKLPSDEEALGRAVNEIVRRVAREVGKEIVGREVNIKEDDFTIRKDVLEDAVRLRRTEI